MRIQLLIFPLCCFALSFTAGATMSQDGAPDGENDVQNTAWPSLDRQLEADRVVSGSALQQLVLENQDFHLLRPEEAHDTIPVPPWLRVLWRKKHPHLEYRADDPTGGYPRVLKELHEWMVSHQDMLTGFTEPDILPAGEVTVGTSERRISSQSSTRSESDIRINFWEPSEIIAASNNVEGSGRQVQYWSIDGGQSWGETTLPLVSRDALHSDPTVDWTSDGTAWSTTLGVTDDAEALRLRLYRSTNNGATWVFDSTISGNQTEADREMAWIDHSATSPYADSLYAIWHNGRPVYMNRKRRNGTWGSPVKVSGSETTGTGIGADVKTNSAGLVFGFWPDTGSRKIYMVRSMNGGQSYSKPKGIASTFDSYDIGIPAMNNRRVLLYVSSGTHKTASKDLVYAVWTDLSGASGCRSASNEPRSTTSSLCKTRIWFTRSTDGGATWSAKEMINNQAGKNDQLNPWLAVDEATGTLAVIYYDTVGVSRKKTNLWYQSSSDDGATWSAPFRITSQATDETAALADDDHQYGDHNGLSGHAGTFFPVWTDRRQGGTEQIWTAALLDQPGCLPPAAPTHLQAVAGFNRIDLTWNPVAGAQEIRIYRSTAPDGVYARIATVSGELTSYANTGLASGRTYYYVLRAALAGCESVASNQASATTQSGNCLNTALYSESFESASGLAGWALGVFTDGSSTADWRGVQSCKSHSGSKVFRFGGTGCTSVYSNDTFAFAQPGGEVGVAVPAGATKVRLSFWHQFDFERGADGGLIAVSLNGQNYKFIPDSSISGFGYNGRVTDNGLFCEHPPGIRNIHLFTGELRMWSNTVVDLDTVCNAISGEDSGCAGLSVHIGFTTFTDCTLVDDGWFIDDVQVTACVP
jgi:hypothetical protein